MRASICLPLVLSALLAVGCKSSDSSKAHKSDGGGMDAAVIDHQGGHDAAVMPGHDAAVRPNDASVGATVPDDDSGEAVAQDAGLDAGHDSGVQDAGQDASSDLDAALDSGQDSALPEDAGQDAAPDTDAAQDSGPVMHQLTIVNFLSWCTVSAESVSHGTTTPVHLMFPEGTVVHLSADKVGPFFWGYWVGDQDGHTTSDQNTSKTTTVTMDADKMIEACCPTTNGGSC